MGRPKKVVEEPKQTGPGGDKVGGEVAEPTPVTAPVDEVKAPDAVREEVVRFVCGTCHVTHVGVVKGDEFGNKKGTFQVLDRKTEMDGVGIIEILCKRCGCTCFKLSPKVEDYKVIKGYGNMALKRG